MAVNQKKLADSLSVKFMNFAGDVYSGLTGKDKIIKTIQGAKKNVNIAMHVADTGSLGYKAGNFLGGGIRESIKDYKVAKEAFDQGTTKHAPSIRTALRKGHTVENTVNGKTVKTLDKKAVAGSVVAASAAGRVATGGGLYRDKDGNTNIIGVPFI